MIMKNLRAIALVLSAVMVITVFSACSIGKASSLPANVNADGVFIYSIIRGEESSDTISSAAKKIRSAIKENIGAKAAIAKDNAVEIVDGSYEILLGNTNRAESTEALQKLVDNRKNNSFDFIIKVINNKICIQSTNDDMIAFAVECFVNTFCKDVESWGLLTNDFEYFYTPETKAVSNTVNGVDIGHFIFVKPVSVEYIITHQAQKIISYYKNYGYEMEFIEDIDQEVTNEILIGNTSREESKSVTVEGDNYVIKVVNNKLVVKGGNELATYKAVEHLYNIIYESTEKGPFSWTDGYVINGKYDNTEENTYTLNFYDDFNTSLVNKNVWGDNNYAVYNFSASSALGGKIYQLDVAGNCLYPEKKLNPSDWIYQSDGSLALAAGRIGEKDFIKSAVSTHCSTLYRYGYTEIRAKFPGQDYSIGLWLNGTATDPTRYGDLSSICITEIDVVENFGSTKYFGSNIHRWWTNYTSDGQSTFQGHNSMNGVSKYHTDGNNAELVFDVERYGKDLAEDYHIYSFYWDDSQLSFALDGRQYLVYDYEGETSVSVHCLMNYLIMSNTTGHTSYGSLYKQGKTADYAELRVDYVKIYQNGELGSQMLKGDGQYVEKASKDNTVVMYPDNPFKNSY